MKILKGLVFYIKEYVRPKGQNVSRVTQMVCKVAEFLKDREIESLVRQDFRDYAEWRFADSVKGATVRRELSIFQAMVNHNHSEGRITTPLTRHNCPKPEGGQPRRRFLTVEEFDRVLDGIEEEKEPRLYRFMQLAIHTGARSRAIEELTRARVDLVNLMIDYNVPGRRVTKKRRAVVPISKALLPLISKWCEGLAPDDPVIGYGPSGRLTSTHHLAKRAQRRAGIDEFGVARHVCRKSFASWRLQAGKPLPKVAALLGDTAVTTERSYGFILPEHLRSTVDL